MLLVFLATEVAIRKVVLPRSQSASTICSAQVNGSSLNGDEFNAAVFGNSYTLCGIDAQEVQEMASVSDKKSKIRVHALNGSYVCEWYWLAKLCYLSSPVKPDVIVLNVGKTSLRDRDAISHRRLALNFGMTNLPIVPLRDMGNNQKEIEFVLSRYSMLINRGRNIGEQVSMKLIPNFTQTQKQLVNRKKTQDGLKGKTSLTSSPSSMDVAKRFFADCRVAGVHVVVVVMPHKNPYEIDQLAFDLFEESKDWVTVIDHRDFPSLTSQDFKDEVHMTPSGEAKYTPVYISDLKQQLHLIAENDLSNLPQ